MTIELIQTCDGCGKDRSLGINDNGDGTVANSRPNTDGWVLVEEHKHLCRGCIKGLLSHK